MNNPVAVTLGANLRRIRESKNITRKQLAEAIGVSEVSIGGYENAHKLPPLDKIFAMADFLDVSTADLTGETRKTADKIIFGYRLQRAKKMMVYLDSLTADLPGYELGVNERGNISIFSP